MAGKRDRLWGVRIASHRRYGGYHYLSAQTLPAPLRSATFSGPYAGKIRIKFDTSAVDVLVEVEQNGELAYRWEPVPGLTAEEASA